MSEGKPQIEHRPAPYIHAGQAIELLLWVAAAAFLFSSPILNRPSFGQPEALLVPGVSLVFVIYAYYVSWRWHTRGAQRFYKDFADALLLIVIFAIAYFFATPFFSVIFLPVAAVALTLDIFDPLGVLLLAVLFVFADLILGPSYYATLGLGFTTTQLGILFGLALFCRYLAHELRAEQEARDEAAAHLHRLEREAATRTVAQTGQNELITNTMHQLLAPIGTIGHIARAGLETDISRQQQTILEEIDEQSRRLTKLVTELASEERLLRDADQRRVINVVEVAQDLVIEFKPLAKARGIGLTFKSGRKTALAHINPAALRLILWYLLENALTYTAAKGKVSVSVTTEDRHLRLTVTDTGFGIDADETERIFEKFYRGSQARTAYPAGLGLGLTTARELAHRQGAKLTLESSSAKGSTFAVTLRGHQD